MISIPAPFPQVGSYALYLDRQLSPDQQRPELVRILELGSPEVRIAFPLRQGASGNQRVAFADLIDGTPLTGEEGRELTDLQRHLFGRDRLTPKMKLQRVRSETLGHRAIWAVQLDRQLRQLRQQQQALAA